MRTARALVGLLCVLALPSQAGAQDDAPALPPPTLPDEDLAWPSAPPPSEPEPQRQILVRVGGRPSQRLPSPDEEEESEPLPDDVSFVVPGDLRTREGGQGRLRLPGQATSPPPLYSVAVGAGWSRLLTAEALDHLRLEQRWEARLDVAPEFRWGVAVAELFGPTFLVEVGPRVGFGASFCNEPDFTCEGVILVQPGVIAGENVADFDLHASLDLRMLVARVFMPAITGGLSFFGGVTMVSVSGQVGLAF